MISPHGTQDIPHGTAHTLYRVILTEKISGPGVSPGGMVTGQIDTCITTCEYILTIKENCQMEIWKETALRFFFINILAFKWANYVRGWGFCFVFSTRGPEFGTEKLSPRRGF